MKRALCFILVAICGTCEPGSGSAGDPFADVVVSFVTGSHAGFGSAQLPNVVLGPPKGGGSSSGSMDVLSLGCGGEIVLKFDAPGILDGPGDDLLVFENPFGAWLELAEISVSEDGQGWHTFPCSGDPASPSGCAGVHPVLASGDDWHEATDPPRAGGDGFDLEAVGLKTATYVRVRDLATQKCEGISAGFDLDAMAAVHAQW